MNDKQKQLLALADELGVGPAEFERLYGQAACTATDRYYGGRSLSHRKSGHGVIIDSLKSGHTTRAVCISAADAIRWGESLAAAGRDAGG